MPILMGATWSFALDGPDATDVIEEVRHEAHRLGREVIGEPTVAEVVGSDGESKWWLSVHVERANVTNEHR
jgi:hypothetical protein